MKRRVLKIAVALILLAALYWHCDARRVAQALSGLDPRYLLLAGLMFVPQIVVSAWRWQVLARPLAQISLLESVRQTLAASAWNLIVPSKLGDFSKAAMLPLDDPGDRRTACYLMITEKAADVAALCVLWLAAAGSVGITAALAIGLLAIWCRTRYSVLSTQHSVLRIGAASLLLWFLHLVQIHLMLLAAGVDAGVGVSFARLPAAIFAGLLPLGICGIGPRDGALIWLFRDLAPSGTMAAVGLLTATRYLIPGALGIPFVWRLSPSGRGHTAEPGLDVRRFSFARRLAKGYAEGS
jgi:hypothetical protein